MGANERVSGEGLSCVEFLSLKVLADDFFSLRLTVGDVSIVELKSNTMIGRHCAIETVNHSLDYLDRRIPDGSAKPVTIGEDCWIGTRVTICPGVTIGRRSVVAAGAVVVKDVEEGTLVGGVPAKLIRRLEFRDEPVVDSKDEGTEDLPRWMKGEEMENVAAQTKGEKVGGDEILDDDGNVELIPQTISGQGPASDATHSYSNGAKVDGLVGHDGFIDDKSQGAGDILQNAVSD